MDILGIKTRMCRGYGEVNKCPCVLVVDHFFEMVYFIACNKHEYGSHIPVIFFKMMIRLYGFPL